MKKANTNLTFTKAHVDIIASLSDLSHQAHVLNNVEMVDCATYFPEMEQDFPELVGNPYFTTEDETNLIIDRYLGKAKEYGIDTKEGVAFTTLERLHNVAVIDIARADEKLWASSVNEYEGGDEEDFEAERCADFMETIRELHGDMVNFRQFYDRMIPYETKEGVHIDALEVISDVIDFYDTDKEHYTSSELDDILNRAKVGFMVANLIETQELDIEHSLNALERIRCTLCRIQRDTGLNPVFNGKYVIYRTFELHDYFNSIEHLPVKTAEFAENVKEVREIWFYVDRMANELECGGCDAERCSH